MSRGDTGIDAGLADLRVVGEDLVDGDVADVGVWFDEPAERPEAGDPLGKVRAALAAQ